MAVPISLAATLGISVDFFSSGYLDVSVHRVRSATLCIQVAVAWLPKPGFPIQRPSDQSLFTSSPRLFAGIHVFRRLFPPRHPPYALIRLTISNTSWCPESGNADLNYKTQYNLAAALDSLFKSLNPA